MITSPEAIGKPLRDLHLLNPLWRDHLEDIERYGVDFVPNANSKRSGERGSRHGGRRTRGTAGVRDRRRPPDPQAARDGPDVRGHGPGGGHRSGDHPDPDSRVGQFTLGLAGGPLLAGLLFAHFGRLMGIVCYMPLAARMLTQEIGLAFFLAAAGFDAGGEFAAMLRQFGGTPFVMSLVVAVIAMTVAVLFARFVLRMD